MQPQLSKSPRALCDTGLASRRLRVSEQRAELSQGRGAEKGRGELSSLPPASPGCDDTDRNNVNVSYGTQPTLSSSSQPPQELNGRMASHFQRSPRLAPTHVLSQPTHESCLATFLLHQPVQRDRLVAAHRLRERHQWGWRGDGVGLPACAFGAAHAFSFGRGRHCRPGCSSGGEEGECRRLCVCPCP